MTTSSYPGHDTKDVSPADVLGTAPGTANFEIRTHSDGPTGTVPFTPEFLVDEPSGNHFGMSQNAGMGWNPAELLRKQIADKTREALSGKTPAEVKQVLEQIGMNRDTLQKGEAIRLAPKVTISPVCASTLGWAVKWCVSVPSKSCSPSVVRSGSDIRYGVPPSIIV